MEKIIKKGKNKMSELINVLDNICGALERVVNVMEDVRDELDGIRTRGTGQGRTLEDIRLNVPLRNFNHQQDEIETNDEDS